MGWLNSAETQLPGYGHETAIPLTIQKKQPHTRADAAQCGYVKFIVQHLFVELINPPAMLAVPPGTALKRDGPLGRLRPLPAGGTNVVSRGHARVRAVAWRFTLGDGDGAARHPYLAPFRFVSGAATVLIGKLEFIIF